MLKWRRQVANSTCLGAARIATDEQRPQQQP
jgi:hypothetical protein